MAQGRRQGRPSGCATPVGLSGTLARQNLPEALRWYGRAAAKGDPYAQTALARLKWTGQGLAKDQTGALALLHKASAAGYQDARRPRLASRHRRESGAARWRLRPGPCRTPGPGGTHSFPSGRARRGRRQRGLYGGSTLAKRA